MATKQAPLALRPKVEVASEVVFEDEASVRQHYGPLIQSARQELVKKVSTSVQGWQEEAKSKSNLIALALAFAGIIFAGLAISSIITGVIALMLIAGTGLGATYLRFRYPVWVARLRAQKVVDLAKVEYQKQLDLDAAQEQWFNTLRERAANDPVATRTRVADETAQEIDDGEAAADEFEGLLKTQERNIAAAKSQFPDQSFAEEDAVQAEMASALETMKEDSKRARKRLDEYIQRTRLIETRLKLAAGARSMAEFMRDDSATDRIRKMVSEVATESAEQEFQTARAALRTSVAAAKRRLQQT